MSTWQMHPLRDTCPGCRQEITLTHTTNDAFLYSRRRLERKVRVHAESCEKYQSWKKGL